MMCGAVHSGCCSATMTASALDPSGPIAVITHFVSGYSVQASLVINTTQ
jgi:hypothetical protein